MVILAYAVKSSKSRQWCCFVVNLVTVTITTTHFSRKWHSALLLCPFNNSSDSPIMESYYIVLSLQLCVGLFSPYYVVYYCVVVVVVVFVK